MSANQNEISQFEAFQLKYNKDADTWNIFTQDGNYWALGAASTIQASSKDEKNACQYRFNWNSDGTVSMSLVNGKENSDLKWICSRKSGQLCIGTSDPVKFYLMFRNRKSLNLRASTGSGFVGLKSIDSGKLETNKTSPDSIIVEYANCDSSSADDNNGFTSCYFKMPANNKYWSISDGNLIACDASTRSCAQKWIMELRNGSCIAIRTLESSDVYLTLTNQGSINCCQSKNATLWEF